MAVGDSVNVLEKGRAILRRENPYPWTQVRAEARILRRDVVFKITKTGFWEKHGKKPAPRGAVQKFTFDSKRRLDLVLRNTADLWESMITLTYPNEFPADGKEVKRHLAAFLQWLRRKKCAYLWVLEFQERQAPHFHILVKGQNGSAWLPKDDLKKEWFNIVASGDEKHLDQGAFIEIIRDEKEAAQYVAKFKKHGDTLRSYFPEAFKGTRGKIQDYFGKEDQKTVPAIYKNVGRFWGCSRLLEKVALMTEGEYAEVKKLLLPMVMEYTSKCTVWGFHWEWMGAGFVFVGGADTFREMLRQAIEIDAGGCPWKLYNGKARDKVKFISLEDRMRLEGQYTLDENIEPSYNEIGQ